MSTMIAKKLKRKISPPLANPTALSGERFRVSPKQLARHPDNRQPTTTSIDAVASSLVSEGQIEPILVRLLHAADEFQNFATYQIISGETRCRAAASLGWDSVEIELVALDDAATLRVLAAANAARQDLDPIAQARLIERLCQSIDQGGSGLTREQAAKMFDLQSGGAASNLVRLLELPEAWQARVASGELPQSYARELLLLIDLGEQSEAWTDLEKEWAEQEQNRGYGAFESREELGNEVERLLEHCTRPVERNDKRRYQAEGLGYEAHPIRFKLTALLEENLRIVRLTMDGVPIRRATNCKLYDELQIPAIKSWLAKKKTGKSDDSENLLQEERRSLSPKQQAAADAERREKAGEVLAKRVEKWRAAWLRELVATAIVHEDHADLCVRLVVWQQTQITKVSYGDLNNLSIETYLAASWGSPWHGVFRGKGQGNVEQLVAHWLLVPARDGYSHPMPDEKVEDLVELLQINLADQWGVMQSRGERPERYQEFFALHNSEQLDALGRELEVGTTGATKKSGKVSAFLNAPKTLKLPKSLRPLRGKRGA
jgi:ParB/RepB/Spo0J family partition protein